MPVADDTRAKLFDVVQPGGLSDRRMLFWNLRYGEFPGLSSRGRGQKTLRFHDSSGPPEAIVQAKVVLLR